MFISTEPNTCNTHDTSDIKIIMHNVEAKKKFEGTKEQFIELYDYIYNNYPDKLREFNSIIMNYLYEMRKDSEFMRYTADIHRSPDFIFPDYRRGSSKHIHEFKMMCIILGPYNNSVDVDTNDGQQRARAEFKRRWEEEKCADSLFMYAICLQHKIGERISDRLTFKSIKDDEYEAYKLYKLGWIKYGHVQCLHQYAYCLSNGVGCVKDKKAARDLYKTCWDEFKISQSLVNYAVNLEMDRDYGELHAANCAEARRLYKLAWDECKNWRGLKFYAECLKRGIGGPVDEEGADKLYKIYMEDTDDL